MDEFLVLVKIMEFSRKFREMPDFDKASDSDKLLPGYGTLRELPFTSPE